MSTPNGPAARLGLPAGVSLAGLGLMIVSIATSVAGNAEAFGGLRLTAMVGGTLAVVLGLYLWHDGRAPWIRRLAAGLWLGMAVLGVVLYPVQWLVEDYLIRFALTGSLVWLSGSLLAAGRPASRREPDKAGAFPGKPLIGRRHGSCRVSQDAVVTVFIGLVCGLLCLSFRRMVYPGAGDFTWALTTATSLLRGQDPYAFTPSALRIPYPLPVAVFGLPLVILPPPAAAATFFGVSAALLSYGILRSDHSWRLLVFLSLPFGQALMFAQWSPLITAAWYFPLLAPLLVLVKPQTALPIALNRLTWRGILLALAVLAISLAVYPEWPLRWVQMIGEYQQVIPAMMLPLGPFLLLAVLFPRDPRARLLLFMSVLPLRAEYDLVPLFLVPSSKRQMVVLVALSLWNPAQFLFAAAGYPWSQGINSYHFYALCMLLYSNRATVRSTWENVRRAAGRSGGFGLAGDKAMKAAYRFLENPRPARQTLRFDRD